MKDAALLGWQVRSDCCIYEHGFCRTIITENAATRESLWLRLSATKLIHSITKASDSDVTVCLSTRPPNISTLLLIRSVSCVPGFRLIIDRNRFFARYFGTIPMDESPSDGKHSLTSLLSSWSFTFAFLHLLDEEWRFLDFEEFFLVPHRLLGLFSISSFSAASSNARKSSWKRQVMHISYDLSLGKNHLCPVYCKSTSPPWISTKTTPFLLTLVEDKRDSIRSDLG